MKKTSKKLLSFFLAVVMLVTSCSVGFSAFAAENNKSMWNTSDIDAQNAFDTLNELADLLPPVLMGIDAISTPVYEKKAKELGTTADQLTDAQKEEIAAKVTFNDVLGVLQPTLLSLLSKYSKDEFLGTYQDSSANIQYHFDQFLAAYANDQPEKAKAFIDNNPEYKQYLSIKDGFDYLDDNGLSLNYYTILNICKNYKDSDSSGKLKEWYDALFPLSFKYIEVATKAAKEEEIIIQIASQIDGNVIVPPNSSKTASQLTYLDATLYELKNFDFDFGENQALVDSKINEFKTMTNALGLPISVNDFADYIYYSFGGGSEITNSNAVEFYNAINTSGSKVTFVETANIYGVGDFDYNITTDITPQNFDSVLSNATLTAAGVSSAAELFKPAPSCDFDAEIARLTSEQAAAQAEVDELHDLYYEKYYNGDDGVSGLNKLISDYQTALSKASTPAKKNTVANTYFGIKNYTTANSYISNNTCHTVKKGSVGTYNAKFPTEFFQKCLKYPAYPAAGSFKHPDDYQVEIDEIVAEKEAYESFNISEDYAKSYMSMCNISFYVNEVIGSNIAETEYNIPALIGLLIEDDNNFNNADDIKDAALALMPNSSATCTLSDADFEALSKALNENRGYLTNTFWENGVDKINGNTVTLPESLVGTAVAEYFGLIDLNRASTNDTRRLGLYNAFANNDMDAVNSYFAEAFEYAYAKVANSTLDFSGNDKFALSASKYIYCNFDYTSYLQQKKNDKFVEAGIETSQVILTQEEQDILFATGNYTGYYDFTDAGTEALGTVIINDTLNNKVVDLIGNPIEILGGQSIEDLINNLFITRVNIVDIVKDIWLSLVKSPVETIVKLLPLVIVAVDELLVPMLLNGENDSQYEFVSTLLFSFNIPQINGMLYDNGSYIGINQIGWDLNTLLPNLMHWLNGDKDFAGITYYNDGQDLTVPLKTYSESDESFVETILKSNQLGSIKVDAYNVTDTDGNKLTLDSNGYNYLNSIYSTVDELAAAYPKAEFSVSMTYKGNVPYLTGIYIADKALRDAKISDLDKIFSKLLDKDENGNVPETPSDLATGLAEVVTELSTLFMTALDEYEANYADEAKYDNSYDDSEQGIAEGKNKTANTGLNNIFVALPRLFDIMENLAAEKYGVDKNAWVYCYEGKIVKGDKPNEKHNAAVDAIKSIAADPDAVQVLDIFSEVLVENWLNAILSLVSNVVSTDNKISQNLPIITGLLNSLGGFGEDSIITDLLNSIFQITRDSDYSFTFTNNHTNPNNKLNGWNKDNAYFLICNISRLVEVIKNLIADFDGGSAQSEDNGFSAISTYGADKTPTYKPGKTVAAKATSHNYTTGELSNTKDLIKNLDTMLSSLLSDSTINDFSLGSNETILAGVTSLLNKYLGKDVTVKGNETVTGVLRLVDSYLFYITGENKNLVAQNKAVNKKTVYSNNALTGLVVETYALIENIADALLSKQFTNSYEDGTIQYNLLTEAIDGIIAPDAISIRLDGYTDAQKTFAKYASWTEISQVTSRNGYNTLRIDWGFKDGDKEGFYDGLAASLRLVTSILGVLLVDTGWYNTVVTPVLGALCTKNGIHLTPYATLVASKKATGYYDETLKAVVSPIAKWIDKLLSAPASTLIKTVQGIAGVLDDKNTKAGTINSILEGAIKPITDEISGVGNILNISSDKLLATSPTLANVIYGVADQIYAFSDGANIQLGIEGYKYGLSGANLIPIVNSYLASTGITLKQISWSKIYSSTPEAALVYVVEYLLETILDNKNLTALAGLINNDIATMVIDAIKAGKLNAQELLGLINTILEATDSPTLAYWSFAQYLQEITENFKYPAGITKAMADKGVENLDGLVESLFPLLASLGVDLGGDNLKAIVNNKLFTNSLLTTIATALYGALDGLDPAIKGALKGLGIVSSTKDVATILTDKSYGATYSSAAKTIASKSSWKNVKNVNWGFTDGSAKAHQGFVNALAAILRPVDDVLAVFLNEGSLKINEVLDSLINNLVVDATTTTLTIADGLDIKLTYAMKNGVLTLKIVNPKSKDSQTSTVKLDLRSLKNLSDLKIEGTNGYNSAIIPLLEALGCTNIKTYAQYQRDIKAAKDSILLDILNPLLGAQDSSFLNKLLAAPVKELTALLPNIAMFLDGYGIEQLVFNLLAPVTNILVEAVDALNVDAILNELFGLTVDEVLEDLSVADLIVPLINMILMSSDNEALNNLEIPDINWNALISFGTASTYTSKATGENGSFLTGKILKNVDNGKVLITVLRYVAKTLINNASVLKNLICGIDAVAKNDTIKTVVASVFNTLSTATPDQVVCAIFYLFSGNPTNAFWDYTAYKTGDYSFSYPSTVDVEFLKNLPPMLDGLIGGLIEGGLNGLIGGKLFKDELIGKLATGLYGAVEGVKVGDGTLTALLAQTGIDFSTKNVAKLLTDEKYGQKFEAAASVIGSAGSWKNVKAESLKFGVTDRDSFFHALVAVLRPLYGVLDVLLNDAALSIFNIVHIPGSDGYTSSIVPLLEAFSCYNVKTQYQYREDIKNEYDAILLDVINPIWDKVEDILNAPLQTLTSMLPNLALLIGNDGLCQILDNLLTPVSALLDAIRPVVDLNTLLPALLSALKVDLNSLLGKIGIKDFKLDIYDINATLKQVLAGDKIIPLVNNILGIIKIKGTPLGIKLNDVDWLQLASHGKTIVGASQAATFGPRIYVEGNSSETLIAVLRYLIDTVNTGNNFDVISSLIGSLLGDNVSDSISDVIGNVLAVLQGDTDEVISKLVELLEMLA